MNNKGLVIVTVSGKTHLNKPYTEHCLSTWGRIQEVDSPYRMISDGLTPEDRSKAERYGFVVEPASTNEIDDYMSRMPALAIFRRYSPTWRHVIDGSIRYRDYKRVLLIDTDVYVVEPCQLDLESHDFVFSRDDIPGYRGSPTVALREPIVPTINPGFMILNPNAVDLEFLERIARTYLVRSKNYWWTRQSALAVLVGSSRSRAMFDGRDVRVVSANRKRSPEEIVNDSWKLLGDSRPVEDPEVIRRSLSGAAVVHLAGYGKKWIDMALSLGRDDCSPRKVRVKEAHNATRVEAWMIAARMFFLQVGRKRVVPAPSIR